MMAVSLAGGPQAAVRRPEIVFQGNYMAPGGVLNFDVAPDGNRFVMLRQASNTDVSEIDILVNWGQQLSRMMKQPNQ